MRRVNQLFEQFSSFENLYHAWLKARKGTGWNTETTRFSFYLEAELLSIQQLLQTGRYQPSQFRYFSIRDPKPRCIAVASFKDRIVHHALVQVLMPVFEPTFILILMRRVLIREHTKPLLKRRHYVGDMLGIISLIFCTFLKRSSMMSC